MVAGDIIEQTLMAALSRICNLIMAIVKNPFSTLACLRSAFDLMALPALGSFAQVTPVTAIFVTARLAVTFIHC